MSSNEYDVFTSSLQEDSEVFDVFSSDEVDGAGVGNDFNIYTEGGEAVAGKDVYSSNGCNEVLNSLQELDDISFDSDIKNITDSETATQNGAIFVNDRVSDSTDDEELMFLFTQDNSTCSDSFTATASSTKKQSLSDKDVLECRNSLVNDHNDAILQCNEGTASVKQKTVSQTVKNELEVHEVRNVGAEKLVSASCDNNSHTVFSSFITGNNKRIEVKKESLNDAIKLFRDAAIFSPTTNEVNNREEASASRSLISSGFTTGNNKEIRVREDLVAAASKRLGSSYECQQENAKVLFVSASRMNSCNFVEGTEKHSETSEKSKNGAGPSLSSTSDESIKRAKTNDVLVSGSKADAHGVSCDAEFEMIDASYHESCELTHSCMEIEKRKLNGVTTKQERMHKIYDEIKATFKSECAQWIATQFRWSWIHFMLNELILDDNFLRNKIVVQMKLRKHLEYSVLRRIVEGDDISWRYMVLAVIYISNDYMVLFDGWYSVKAIYDDLILNLIKKHKIRLGTRLMIFGAELLLKKPVPVSEVTGPSLKLFYNSLLIDNRNRRLGYRKRISFNMPLCRIEKLGGPISSIEGKVIKYIEFKYVVSVGSYRSIVCNLEAEIDRIACLAKKSEITLCSEGINISKYSKFVISDGGTECIVTWWNPSEVKVGEWYRFVYLRPAGGLGLHVNTVKRTYAKKLQKE